VDEVLELKEAFEAKGYTPASALERAVGYVRKEESPAGTVDKKKTDVEKNLKDDKKQPADINKAGKDSDKGGAKDVVPDMTNMTDEEIDALPKETLRRMRGDFV